MAQHIGRITKSEESTKLLTMLHRDDEPHFSRATRIAADSLHHIDGGATGHRRSPRMETEGDDSTTKNIHRILPHAGQWSAGKVCVLKLNDFIREAVQGTVEENVRLHAAPEVGDVPVMANPEEMSQVLATLLVYGSKIVKRGGTITMLAKILQIENALVENGGFAFLSVSSTDVDWSCYAANHVIRSSIRQAFRAIRSVIRGYNSSVRVVRQKDKVAFNIYLPVLHGTADLLSAVDRESYRREEAAWKQ